MKLRIRETAVIALILGAMACIGIRIHQEGRALINKCIKDLKIEHMNLVVY